MKLIQFSCSRDHGHQWYVTLFRFKRRSVLQTCFSWDDQPMMPYVSIIFGGNGFFSFLVYLYRFGFSLDVFSFNFKIS